MSSEIVDKRIVKPDETGDSNKQQRAAVVPCCLCGTLIEPNASSMCLSCLKTQVDITADIPKFYTLKYCKDCGRYHHNNSWVSAPPESRELLQMLVKTVRGINKMKLVDASFVWTEPHSMRLKIKLTVQKDVFAMAHDAGSSGGAVIQQQFIAEFALERLYCPDCYQLEGAHEWNGQVQLRQHGVDHKRTLYYIEQCILQRKAHRDIQSVVAVPDGLDFNFAALATAQKFIEVLESICPCRVTHSKKQVGHDDHSNIFRFKNTWLLEIPPISRDDLVLIPRGGKLGEGGLFICSRISSVLSFVDPVTGRELEVSGPTYWANPFKSLFHIERMKQFTVIDSIPLSPPPTSGGGNKGGKSAKTEAVAAAVAAAAAAAGESKPDEPKYILAEATVSRSEDFGLEEATYVVQTHLGRYLNSGDFVDCYDLKCATLDIDEDTSKFNKRVLRDMPDLVIVRKSKKQATETGDAPEKKTKQELRREQINSKRKKAAARRQKEIIRDTSALNAKQLEIEERDREEAREEFEEEMMENGTIEDEDGESEEENEGDDEKTEN